MIISNKSLVTLIAIFINNSGAQFDSWISSNGGPNYFLIVSVAVFCIFTITMVIFVCVVVVFTARAHSRNHNTEYSGAFNEVVTMDSLTGLPATTDNSLWLNSMSGE